MTIPKVSVLITCFSESDEIIAKSLRSALQEKNLPLEVILIDDHRKTPFIAPVDLQQDERLFIQRNERNLGLTKSLNKGLSLCRGEFIARLDSDDFCLPHRLTEQAKFLDENTAFSFCGTRYQEIYPNGLIEEPSISRAMNFREMKKALVIENPMAHSTLMVRRSALLNVSGYNEDIRYAQDYDLYVRLLENGDQACVLNTVAVQRTWSLGSISFAKAKAQRWIAMKCSARAAKSFGVRPQFLIRLVKNCLFLATPQPLLNFRLKKKLKRQIN